MRIVRRESATAKRAYRDYELMGPTRSLDQLVKRYHAVPMDVPPERQPPTRRAPTVYEWAHSFHWDDRVLSFDRRLADAEIARLAEKRAQMAQERLTEAATLRATGTLLIAEILRRIQIEDGDPVSLVNSIREVPTAVLLRALAAGVRAVDVGQTKERLELGESTARVGTVGDEQKPALETILESLPDEFRETVRSELILKIQQG